MIKRILIVSDSHGNSENIRLAIDRERPDMLIHLGDIEDDPGLVREWLDEAAREYNSKEEDRISLPVPAVFIQGNCDRYGGSELKQTAVFEVNGHRFFCTHGHRQGVGFGPEGLIYSALENDCDIAIYGHTHIPDDDTFVGELDGNEIRILNPGSISLPRGGSSKSYMVMTFDGDDYSVELKCL